MIGNILLYIQRMKTPTDIGIYAGGFQALNHFVCNIGDKIHSMNMVCPGCPFNIQICLHCV